MQLRKIFSSCLSMELSRNTETSVKGAADLYAYMFLKLFLQPELKRGLWIRGQKWDQERKSHFHGSVDLPCTTGQIS